MLGILVLISTISLVYQNEIPDWLFGLYLVLLIIGLQILVLAGFVILLILFFRTQPTIIPHKIFEDYILGVDEQTHRI